MRPPWHGVKSCQPPQLMHIHVLLYLSSQFLCLLLFHHFFFLRAMWPFPVLSQSPSPWRSPTPAASCSCRGRHTGCRGSSLWHCSSARGTRAGFSWPLTSHCRKAWSGCSSVTPDCAYRLAERARPSWSSAQVSPLLLSEFILLVLRCEYKLILSKCCWQRNIFTNQNLNPTFISNICVFTF